MPYLLDAAALVRIAEGEEMKRKRSKVYREAARFIESGVLVSACEAIVLTPNSPGVDYNHDFEELFKPIGVSRGEYWFGPTYKQANQDERILALCFAAAIAESEGE